MGTFVRHEEPSGDIWYTIKSKLDRIRRPKDPKFFEMPNIVLDLDADGQKGVREFLDQDEQKMKDRWAVNQQKETIKAVVSSLEREAARLTQSWDDILAQPASPWRINNHDLMSVALGGVSGHPDHARLHRMGLGTNPDFLQKLCQINGIPAYALKNDNSTLEWMLIRKSAMEQRVEKVNDQSPTSEQFAKAIEGASTFFELRRVIANCSLGCLGNEHEADFGTSDFNANSIAPAIQNAIERLLQECEPGSPQLENAKREAMAIVGNTEISMRFRRPLDSVHLWAFALELAKSHSLAAKIESLRRGFEAGYASFVSEARQEIVDIILKLPSDIQQLDDSELGPVHSRSEGRVLLELLTGVASMDQLSAASVRSFITNADLYGITSELRADLHVSYIMMLGQLGAVRTLWAEHRAILDAEAEHKFEQQNLSQSYVGPRKAILEAAMSGPPFRSAQTPLTRKTSSMERCVLADCVDIQSRAEAGPIEAKYVGPRALDASKLEEALDSTLRRWLGELERE